MGNTDSVSYSDTYIATAGHMHAFLGIRICVHVGNTYILEKHITVTPISLDHDPVIYTNTQ